MAKNDFRRFFQHAVGVGIQMIGEIFLNVINVYDRSQTTIRKIPAIKSCTIVDLHIRLYVIGQKIFQKRCLIFLRHLLVGNLYLNVKDQDNAGIFQCRLHISIFLHLQASLFK